MERSIFTPEKKKAFRSLYSSPSNFSHKTKQKDSQPRNQLRCKPNFLYFTERDRQKIHLFESACSTLRNNHSPQQKQIDFRISNSFHKKFKLQSNNFDIKKLSIHKIHLDSSSTQRKLVAAGKSKRTLKKKAYLYKNEEPCVGTYNAKPQYFMKQVARNFTFRKGKSCHNFYPGKQNRQRLSPDLKESKQNQIEKKIETKALQIQGINGKMYLSTLKAQKPDNPVKKHVSLLTSSKIKIRCFDMGRQTAREPLKKISNKTEQVDFQNDYIEKNHKLRMVMCRPMNASQLQGMYEKQKRKYRIESSCGILKHIKLEDFIKLHRNQLVIQEQSGQ